MGNASGDRHMFYRLVNQPVGVSGFQGVVDMQIVPPGFGPVLRGMGTRVGTDEMVAPVPHGPLLVVARKGRAVIQRLVTEYCLELLPQGLVPCKSRPVVMP